MSVVNLLLVEDDLMDSAAVIKAARAAGLRGRLEHAVDAEDALARLRGDGCVPLPKPHAIVLDWRLPGLSGQDFVRTLRADPDLRGSLIFVLTGSDSEADRRAAYDLNVAGYIRKPRSLEALHGTMVVLKAFLDTVDL